MELSARQTHENPKVLAIIASAESIVAAIEKGYRVEIFEGKGGTIRTLKVLRENLPGPT